MYWKSNPNVKALDFVTPMSQKVRPSFHLIEEFHVNATSETNRAYYKLIVS
jgi:hypothetical protein